MCARDSLFAVIQYIDMRMRTCQTRAEILVPQFLEPANKQMKVVLKK